MGREYSYRINRDTKAVSHFSVASSLSCMNVKGINVIDGRKGESLGKEINLNRNNYVRNLIDISVEFKRMDR